MKRSILLKQQGQQGALSQHFKPLICPVDSNIQTELKEEEEEGGEDEDYLHALQSVVVMGTMIIDHADGSALCRKDNIYNTPMGLVRVYMNMLCAQTWPIDA